MERIPDNPENRAEAANVVRRGGLVAYPTDTLYGLGADAFNSRAVAKVFAAKRREAGIGLPLLLAGSDQLADVTGRLPAAGSALAERFWPGALTLVVRRAVRVPASVTGGANTVAVRIPGHPAPRAIARLTGVPLIGTSANLHGGPSPASPDDVAEQLGGVIDLLLDGGPCEGDEGSTIVDVTVEQPALIREGSIPFGDIERALEKAGAGEAAE